jgi:hypothetical protein
VGRGGLDDGVAREWEGDGLGTRDYLNNIIYLI